MRKEIFNENGSGIMIFCGLGNRNTYLYLIECETNTFLIPYYKSFSVSGMPAFLKRD